MNLKINQNYARNLFKLNFLFNSIIKKKREEIFNIINQEFHKGSDKDLLDVGTTSSLQEHENHIIKNFYGKVTISCLSNLDLDSLKKIYPDIKTFTGDARKMNFTDNSFDLVISNATIEHVGSDINQIEFIKECIRVSKKKIIISTPNRFYPIEFHTKLPLIHYFKKNLHRKILKYLGEDFLSKEENLNLLSKKDLVNFCVSLNIKNFKIKSVNLFAIPSNFILIIEK